ncbi:MAG: FAD-binding protein, partial [Lewinella sp.]|nr:FAD-binding protein [Lewinella sp.]
MMYADFSLLPYNTFQVPARAEHFVAVKTPLELDALDLDKAPALLLGGGSNLLLLDEVPGLTVHLALQGLTLLPQTPEGGGVLLRAAAGLNWHQFVLYTLQKGWDGLENLALIPGTVGGAPVQNIGAYGLEVAERIHAVHAYEYG